MGYYVLVALVAAAATGVLLYVLMKRGVLDDEYEAQARLDQRSAAYPGCARGLMNCTAFCSSSECSNGSRPKESWVVKRAGVLRQRKGCPHTVKYLKFHTLFPELGPVGEQCAACKLVRKQGSAEWIEQED